MPLVHLFLGFLLLQTPKPGSVSGVVSNAVTGTPLRKARLNLQSGPNTYAAVSDASGHFGVAEVAPGMYNVRTECDGFQATAQPLRIAEDQHVDDMAIRLTPLGVIAGKVLDEDGAPMAQIQVEAQMETFGRTGRRRAPAGIASTDDRGEYRIFDLAAGRYFMLANDPRSNGSFGGRLHSDPVETAYVSTWYPNVSDASQAPPTMLGAGAELDGVDIHMHRQRVFHIRGKAVLPPGQQAAVEVSPCGGPNGPGVAAPILRDGTFDAGMIVPGTWCLLVSAMVDPTHSYFARQPVTVADHDVNNVNLLLAPAAEIRGQILVDGAPTSKLPHMPIRLDPVELPGRGAGVAAQPDGTFVMQNVAPAQYRLTDLNLYGMYLKAIRFNGQDCSDGLVQVPSGGGQMTLLFATDSGEISGTVQGADLVTAESSSSLSGVPAISPVNPQGSFGLRGLAPGEYKVLAWETRNMGLLQYADFRKLFESRAVTVTVQPKGHETVQLNAIGAADIDAAMARVR